MPGGWAVALELRFQAGVARTLLCRCHDDLLGRYATNEEFAALAVFLVSDDSAYCDGASFVADGGMLTA